MQSGSEKKDTFYPVPFRLFHNGSLVPNDLYLRHQIDFVLFRQKGSKWTRDDTDRLLNYGIEDLYVKAETQEEVVEFIEHRLHDLIKSPEVSSGDKISVLYSSTISISDWIFNHPETQAMPKRSSTLVKSCLDHFGANKNAFHELFRLANTNLSEHNHGIHCMTYAMKMAQEIGGFSSQELFALALGALLHDIGKSKINPAILHKPGALDEKEWMEMQRHPRYGADILSKHSSIPELTSRIVLEHHERIAGDGYPKRLKGSDIHIFSKIVGICDVFDSMTARRVYKESSSAFTAARELLQARGDHFDSNLVSIFIKMMK